jgi:hypothetical protein
MSARDELARLDAEIATLMRQRERIQRERDREARDYLARLQEAIPAPSQYREQED